MGFVHVQGPFECTSVPVQSTSSINPLANANAPNCAENNQKRAETVQKIAETVQKIAEISDNNRIRRCYVPARLTAFCSTLVDFPSW